MKKLILLLMIISLTTLSSATVLTFDFGDTSQNVTFPSPGITYSNSIVFQVTTTTNVLCRYGETKGISFDSMTGTFNENFETIHKKTFPELQDGIYRYFVKCRDKTDISNTSKGKAELEAVFKISNTISAIVILEDDGADVLNSGKYEISLVTSKVPSTTPRLSYSYDGISYNPIVLHGSGINWKGYMIIPESFGEGVGSFKFEATDLEGRPGKDIIGSNVFTVDTKAPLSVSTFEAIGEYGQIRLEWFLPEENTDTMKIYRSESPNVGQTDYYKSVDSDEEYYIDTDVTSGKTYYYRIAMEDDAGNLADLSKEVVAATRKDNYTTSTGLSPELIGLVDAVLTEIGLLEDDIQRAELTINNKDDTEKNYIKTLGISDSLQSSKSELNALIREVENYKLQDLTQEVLNSRIASSRIKINVIKKKVPDSITLVDSGERESIPSDEDLRAALLEHSSELSPSLIDKSVKASNKMIEEKNIKIGSKISIFEVIYLDGSKSSKSLIEHSINSELEKAENRLILLKISSSINSGPIKIKNLNYLEEGNGLFRFETDTKKITYIIDSKLEQSSLSEINVAPIEIAEETQALTGYFLSELPGTESLGVSLLVLTAFLLVGYFMMIKRRQENDFAISFIDKAKTIKNLQQSGQIEQANSLYDSLKVEYIGLSDSEKSKVFKHIKHLSKKK